MTEQLKNRWIDNQALEFHKAWEQERQAQLANTRPLFNIVMTSAACEAFHKAMKDYATQMGLTFIDAEDSPEPEAIPENAAHISKKNIHL